MASNIDWPREIERSADMAVNAGRCAMQVIGAVAGTLYEPLNDRAVLYVDVRHELWAVYKSQPEPKPPYDLISDRLSRALLERKPTAKSGRVERRLMLARGEQARKSKARRREA